MKAFRIGFEALLLSLFLTAPASFAADSCPSALLGSSYKPDDSKSLPENFFLRRLDETVHAYQMAARNQGSLVDNILKEDFRVFIFRLQGVAHLYEDRQEDVVQKIRADAKSLEDAVGKVDLLRSLAKEAKKRNLEEVESRIEDELKTAELKMTASLKGVSWLHHPKKLTELKGRLADVPWNSEKKERRYYLKTLHDYVHDLRKDIKHEKFTRADIEEGFHEMRRRLRWILIFAQGADGLVTNRISSKGILPHDQGLLETIDMGTFKLAKPWTKNPIEIPQVVFAALRRWVIEVGEKKEAAEIQIQLKKFGADLKDEVLLDPEELARIFQKKIADDEVLKVLEEILEDQ